MRFAVSLVTCRHAASRSPFRGWSSTKRRRMRVRTGISRAAQSIRSWPDVARFRSLTSWPRELTFKWPLLVEDLADELPIPRRLTALAVAELDQHLDPDDRRAELPH